jgi:MFS transporter, DHA2 family, multidrug resistance protein
VQSASMYSPKMQATLGALAQTMHKAGASTADAMDQAYGVIYQNLLAQAQTLAYIDTFWILAVVALCLLPLVFLLKRVEPGKAPAGAP